MTRHDVGASVPALRADRLTGLLIRRSIPAMVAAFIPWLTIRLVVEFVFRPHFMTPLTARVSCPPTAARVT